MSGSDGKKRVISIIVIIAIVIVIAAAVAIGGYYLVTRGGGGGENQPGLVTITHAPIYIYGNDNFTAANGVVAGSGTENDPYIIENWGISAENANGIWIINTTAYFIIRNCLVENGEMGHFETPPENDGMSFPPIRYGIMLSYVINGIINHNNCEKNWAGIALFSSNNNTISNNNFGNNLDGIILQESSNNTFRNNTCENNSYGISLVNSSDNNQIYHNNFINNSTQAYDDGSNYWDNGFLSGGNYWSDHPPIGFETTPYYIPGDNNQDRWPLIYPWTAANNEQNKDLDSENRHENRV